MPRIFVLVCPYDVTARVWDPASHGGGRGQPGVARAREPSRERYPVDPKIPYHLSRHTAWQVQVASRKLEKLMRLGTIQVSQGGVPDKSLQSGMIIGF